jgi:hypothetical protein
MRALGKPQEDHSYPGRERVLIDVGWHLRDQSGGARRTNGIPKKGLRHPKTHCEPPKSVVGVRELLDRAARAYVAEEKVKQLSSVGQC